MVTDRVAPLLQEEKATSMAGVMPLKYLTGDMPPNVAVVRL